MVVAFELGGHAFTALNGGPVFTVNEAISLQVNCRTQEEIDHYWERLSAGWDPRARQCGWLKNRYGVSWQVVPDAMDELFADAESPGAKRAVMAMLRMKKLVGATIMGRNMFGGHPGPWDRDRPWTGWWGDDPPFHHPVFVLTHHAREPLVLDGGNRFTFVTDGIASALEQAPRAAGGRDVSLAGGAKAAQQYLAAGLVDEMEINLVPVLLGRGERLFGGGDDLHGLELARTVATPNVTHLKFVRRASAA